MKSDTKINRNWASYRAYATAALTAQLNRVGHPTIVGTKKFRDLVKPAIRESDRIARQMCFLEDEWVEEGERE